MSAVVQDLLRVAVEQFGVTSAELRTSSDLQIEVATAAGLDDVRDEQWRAVAEAVDNSHERAARSHAGSKGPTRCRSCGAPLRMVLTESGKSMPLDPLPRPMGNVVMVNRGQSKLVAKVVSNSSLPVKGAPAYQSHFASCPDAAARRRSPRGSGGGNVTALPGPRCESCREPMNATHVQATGERTHPSCPDIKPPEPAASPEFTLLPGGG